MDSLVQLLIANESGQLRDRVGKGFIRTLKDKEECLEGLTTVLKRRFPRMTRREFSAHRDKNGEKLANKQKGKSSIRLGNSFHTHVLHKLFCTSSCLCKRKSSSSPNGIVKRMLNTAHNALLEQGLDPLVGEVVLAPPPGSKPVGTRFDLLARHLSHWAKPLVVVSWKTCGSCPFAPGATAGRFGDAILIPGKVTVNTSEDYVAQRDLAQLACEIHMLRATHNVPIGGGLVIYLYPRDPSKYRAIWIDPQSLPLCGRVWNTVVEGK